MFWKKKRMRDDLFDEDLPQQYRGDINDVFDEDENRLEKPKRWYHYVFMQKEVLVMYLICAILAVMIATPLSLESTGFFPDTSGEKVFGICGVRDNFRVDCAPDKRDISETECDRRDCCYDTATPNATSCYHRMPSPMSSRYKVKEADNTGTADTSGYDNVRKTANFKVYGDSNRNLVFELGDSLSAESGQTVDNLTFSLSCPDGGDCIGEVITLDVRFQNSGNKSSLLRTHFGPIIYSEQAAEISLYLPNNYLYASGLQNLIMGDVQEQTLFNLGVDTQVHLPVVIGMYDIQRWYAVYLETGSAGLQTLHPGSGDQPLITWTTLGGNIKIRILVASSPIELQKKLKKSLGVDQPTDMLTDPDTLLRRYGYHICRNTDNFDGFRSDYGNMTASDISIPYDSDCINEKVMATSFTVNRTYLGDFLPFNLDVVLPLVVQTDLQEEVPCVKWNSDNQTCRVGSFDDVDVSFPDVFDSQYSAWFSQKFSSLAHPKQSVYLHDAWPRDDSQESNKQGLQFVPRDLNLKNQLDMYSSLSNADRSDNFKNLMAEYPKKLLEIISAELKDVRTDVAMLGMPTDVTFTGSKFSASWENMRRSLREALFVSSIGLPYYSMSACGTSSSSDITDGLLCLRWFQMAAFMPGLHSWYSGDDVDRLPYKLEKTYLRYIKWALEDRYKMLPYYRTLDKEWHRDGVPIIRPMFVMHPEAKYLNLWSQFYLGDRILVAPVLKNETNIVEIKFPPGSWYRLGSGIPVNLPYQGATISVSSKLYEIPAFIKGGAAIVYHEVESGINLRETEKRPYLLMIPLECSHSPRQKQLSSCKCDGETYLGSDQNLQINVVTDHLTGQVNLKIQTEAGNKNSHDATKTSEAVNNNIVDAVEVPVNNNIVDAVEVLGLQPGGSTLTITLPGGATITANNHPDDDSAYAEYNPDKQYLVIRKMNLIADVYNGKSLQWSFSN